MPSGLFDWYQVFEGKHGFAVGSQSQAHILQRRFYAPIQAEIALMTGDPAADSNSIREYQSKLEHEQQVNCTCCGGLLWSKTLILDKGHSKDCPLFQQAMAVLAEPELKFSERAKAFKADRADRLLRKAAALKKE